MKYHSLFNNFSPHRKCGVETALLMAGSAALTYGSTQMTNDTNRSINNKQMAFSASEAEKQRNFQRDEWTRQYQIQRDEWYKQLQAQSDAQYNNFLREATYNSPQNQVQRLAQAGLNPSAVLGGQGSSGLVSAASGNLASIPSPSVPTGGSVSGASAAAPSPISMQNPFNGVISQVGTFLKDVASASKDNATIEPLVRLMGSQLVGQELQNEWQTFENDVLSQIKDTKVKQAFQNLQNSALEYTLKLKMGENVDADTVLKNMQSALTYAKARCSEKEYEQLSFTVDHLADTWMMQMKLLRSESAKNVASANNLNALTETENTLREFRKNNLDLLNKYQETMNNYANDEYRKQHPNVDKQIAHDATQLIESMKREGLLTGQQEAELEKAQKENNWWYVEHLLLPIITGGIPKPIIPLGK